MASSKAPPFYLPDGNGADERLKGVSEGARLDELKEMLKAEGAVDALNLDGGGSNNSSSFFPSSSSASSTSPSSTASPASSGRW